VTLQQSLMVSSEPLVQFGDLPVGDGVVVAGSMTILPDSGPGGKAGRRPSTGIATPRCHCGGGMLAGRGCLAQRPEFGRQGPAGSAGTREVLAPRGARRPREPGLPCRRSFRCRECPRVVMERHRATKVIIPESAAPHEPPAVGDGRRHRQDRDTRRGGRRVSGSQACQPPPVGGGRRSGPDGRRHWQDGLGDGTAKSSAKVRRWVRLLVRGSGRPRPRAGRAGVLQ